MDSAITLIGYALAVLLMLMTGLGAEIDKIRAGFSTARRRLTLRVIAVNLLLIPLIAIAFVRWAQPQGGIWAGIVLLALCPAAPMAPPLVTAANGDTSWAVALTVPLVLFGTLLLLVYLPLTGSLWQSHSATSEELSTLRLLLTMLPFLVPLAIGLALRIVVMRKAAALLRLVRPVTRLLIVAFMMTFVALRFNEMKDVGWYQLTIDAGFFIACGVLCALFMGPVSRSEFVTAVVLTIYRNFMAALVLCIPLGLSSRVQTDLIVLSGVGLVVVLVVALAAARFKPV